MRAGSTRAVSLLAIARCNKHLHALVDRADHLFELFLAEIKFAETEFVDDTDWIRPNGDHVVSDLRLPPRIDGGSQDEMIIAFSSSTLVTKKLVVVDWYRQMNPGLPEHPGYRCLIITQLQS